MADGPSLLQRQAIGNLVALLNEAGVETENVIKTTVFIKNMDDFAKINAIYSEFFVDGMGKLYNYLKEKNAKFVGKWSTDADAIS